MLEPRWLSLARAELGVKEVSGNQDSAAILGYWARADLRGIANHDEVPWCAAFVGAMLKSANCMASGQANARSYEAYGRRLETPCLGAVVVLSRPPSTWQGHVAFYLGTNLQRGHVRLIGGNQGDAVSIADFALDRVIAYRWPTSELIQPEWVGPLAADGAAPAQVKTS